MSIFLYNNTYCFNLKIRITKGGATAPALVFFLDSPPRQARPNTSETLLQKIMHYDPIGNIIFLPCIVCILLALQWGGTTYPWSDGRIIALLVRHFVVHLPAGDDAEYAKDDVGREAMKRRLLRGVPWATVAPANAIVRLEPYEVWYDT